MPKMHWIPSYHFLYYHHAQFAPLGPKDSREARTEVKHDLYLQRTLDKGLPSVLRSLYPQSKVEMKESGGMLTYL